MRTQIILLALFVIMPSIASAQRPLPRDNVFQRKVPAAIVVGNGSGDYVIAFSTVSVQELNVTETVGNSSMSPLFQAVIEATEEAIYNSLFAATTVEGHKGTVHALPIDPTLEILRRYGVIKP